MGFFLLGLLALFAKYPWVVIGIVAFGFLFDLLAVASFMVSIPLRLFAMVFGLLSAVFQLVESVWWMLFGLVFAILRLLGGLGGLIWGLAAVGAFAALRQIQWNTMEPLERNLRRASHGFAWPVVLLVLGVPFAGEFGLPPYWYLGIPAVVAIAALCAGMAVTGFRRAAGARDGMLATRAAVKAAVGLVGLIVADLALDWSDHLQRPLGGVLLQRPRDIGPQR